MIKTYKTLVFLVIIFSAALDSLAQEYEIASPNNQIKIYLHANNDQGKSKWLLRINYNNQVAIPSVTLGLKSDQFLLSNQLRLLKAGKINLVKDDYIALHGKRKHCINEASERIFYFTQPNGPKLNLVVRAYNDGIAFRYVLPDKQKNKYTITDELTAYEFNPVATRWLQRFTPSYEDFFPKQEKDIKQGQWGYPGLFKTDTGAQPCWMLVTEAGLDSTYCATKLSNAEKPDQYKILFPAQTDGHGIGSVQPTIGSPWMSPWRVIIMGQLADVVASTMVEDVSPASKLKDVSWIKPGVSSWVYWANNHGTKDYKKVVAYIDLAARMNWPYTLFDWEWDEMGNGGKLEDAVKYAASKGIKPLMWYNSGGPHNTVGATPRDRMLTHANRLKEFAWLKQLGVYGVKIDFFESDKQDIIKYYIDILEDAAQFKLMVNFHGATVPRGWTRTYPNLMSTEAVYGAEQYNNGPAMTTQAAAHNATLPFTRNVIGPMDYTPVTFTNSQHPHTTTFAHELALTVIFESGIQHFADRPEGFDNLPDAPKMFLRNVPTSWDDTKLIDGYPGKKVIIARQKAGKWYLAGINGEERAGKNSIKLNFLPEAKTFRAILMGDGDYDSVFHTQYLTLTSKDTLDVPWLARGGFTAVFEEL